jgi:hypothetical protein
MSADFNEENMSIRKVLLTLHSEELPLFQHLGFRDVEKKTGPRLCTLLNRLLETAEISCDGIHGSY